MDDALFTGRQRFLTQRKHSHKANSQGMSTMPQPGYVSRTLLEQSTRFCSEREPRHSQGMSAGHRATPQPGHVSRTQSHATARACQQDTSHATARACQQDISHATARASPGHVGGTLPPLLPLLTLPPPLPPPLSPHRVSVDPAGHSAPLGLWRDNTSTPLESWSPSLNRTLLTAPVSPTPWSQTP